MKLLDVLPIFEARKNPLLNPKISAYDQLLQYKDNPNIFIHMGTVNKVGLNVLSTYDTPLGIYCYPLKYVWDRYIEIVKSLSGLPFAEKAPYVHILEFKGNGKFINMDEYSETDLQNDIDKLKSLFKYDDNAYKEFMKLMNMHVTNIEDIDVDDFEMDDLELGIHYGPKRNKIITMINNAKNKYYTNRLASNKVFGDIIAIASKQAKNNSAIAKFWNITRYLSNYGDNPVDILHNMTVTSNGKFIPTVPKNQYHVTSNMSRNWNHILRKLGYAGFNDRTGLEIIHGNEPIQSVFLSKTSVNHIRTILNKEYAVKDIKKFKIGKNDKELLTAYQVYDYIRSLLDDATIEITKQQYKLLMSDLEISKSAANNLIWSDFIIPKELKARTSL
jgi:hypothetical protein